MSKQEPLIEYITSDIISYIMHGENIKLIMQLLLPH